VNSSPDEIFSCWFGKVGEWVRGVCIGRMVGFAHIEVISWYEGLHWFVVACIVPRKLASEFGFKKPHHSEAVIRWDFQLQGWKSWRVGSGVCIGRMAGFAHIAAISWSGGLHRFEFGA
jgi:hypothetical protein